jgi:alpha/beta hydrolase fold
MEIMPGFTLTDIETSGARIRLRHGGSGPPLLLLHGNPLTHVSWHAIAPRLSERFRVVAADLGGYGDSSAPPEEPDSSNYSFRAMAQDQVEVMKAFGHDRFYVAGPGASPRRRRQPPRPAIALSCRRDPIDRLVAVAGRWAWRQIIPRTPSAPA